MEEDMTLTASELDQLRHLLEEQRAAVLARLGRREALARQVPEPQAEEIDQANHEAAHATDLRLLHNDRQLLAEVEHALSKFARGTYGLCEGTGEPIEPKRLAARPWSRYCAAYKDMLEKKAAGYSRG